MSAKAAIRVVITLDEDLLTAYDAQARESNKTIEETLTQRLAQCKDLDVSKGRALTVTPEERQTLEKALGKSFYNGTDLARHVVTNASLRVNSQVITLDTKLLQLLKDRCGRRDFQEFVKTTVVEELQRYVGLR